MGTLLWARSPGDTQRQVPTSVIHQGKLVKSELGYGDSRAYQIPLRAGEYVHGLIKHPFADALLTVEAPDGKNLLELDTADLAATPTQFSFIAPAMGTYRVRLNVRDRFAGKAKFGLLIDQVRKAGAEEEKLARAEQPLAQGHAKRQEHDYSAAAGLFEQSLAAFKDARDKEGQGDALRGLGQAYEQSSSLEKAIETYQKALAIERDRRDRSAEAAVLHRLGQAYEDASRYDDAIQCELQAIQLEHALKEERHESRTLNNLGNVYTRIAEYDKALGYYARARQIALHTSDFQVLASTLVNSGNVYYHLDQFDKAINLYEQALPMYRESPNLGGEPNLLNSLGRAYDDMGQHEKAIDYFEQAIAIARKIHSRVTEAIYLVNIGFSYWNMAEYGKAVKYYEEALGIERELKDRHDEANTLNALALVYDDLNEPEKAREGYEQALAIYYEVNDRERETWTLSNLAGSARRAGQYSKAMEYIQRCLAIARAIHKVDGETFGLNALGELYSDQGQYDKAVDSYQRALALSRQTKGRDEEGGILNKLASVDRKRGDYAKATVTYQEALLIAEEVKDRQSEGEALTGLMESWKARANPRLAIFYGKQAVNTVQGIRADVKDLGTEAQKHFLAGNERPYHALAELLIGQGRLIEAEQVLNLLKEEEYFEYVRRDGAETAVNRRADLTPDETQWEKRYREIGSHLVAIGAERGQLLAKKTLSAEERQRLEGLEQDLAAGNQRLESFLADLATHFNTKPEASAKVEQLRDAEGLMDDLRELPAGTVAIYTLAGEDKYRSILVTPDVQKAYEYPIKAADLNRKVLALRQVLQNPNLDPRPRAQELYSILLGSMAEDLRQAGASTLMWSLDGTLRYLPLAALFDGNQYLIEKFRIAVFTPASNARLKDRSEREWEAAGFGVTTAIDGVPALPEVRSELKGIIRGDGTDGVLKGEIKLDRDFTEDTMRQALLKRYAVIHIASHFSFKPGNDEQSFLLLGDGSHLSLDDLKTLPNMFGGVQLITLSACNTGVGDTGADGKEVEGFGVLAQRKGAKAVIASLWPVADESTSILMREFYRIREASPGMTKAEALRQAQLELLRGTAPEETESGNRRAIVFEDTSRPGNLAPIFPADAKRPYAHPFYWAPFFLMGNWL